MFLLYTTVVVDFSLFITKYCFIVFEGLEFQVIAARVLDEHGRL